MYLNVIQLAESLGVEESVVEGWIRNENLPCVRDSGRLIFDRALVAAWAAERGLAAKAGFLAPAKTAPGPVIRLEKLLQAGGVWRNVDGNGVGANLEQIVARLPGASPEIRKMLGQRARSPGGITWAPVGHGIALPHLRSHVALGRDAGLLAVLFLSGALEGNEKGPDGIAITRLLFFIAPSPRAHLELLARLSSLLRDPETRRLVLEAAPDAQLFWAMKNSDEKAAASIPREGQK
jgi:PTS system nitrogen regulatory IIA component